MMEIINLHSYFFLNVAMAVSFIFSYLILSLPLFHKKIFQTQRLTIGRLAFLATLVAFFLAPYLIKQLSGDHYNNFQLQPILKQASAVFLDNHEGFKVALDSLHPSSSLLPSIKALAMFILVLGFGIFSARYISSILLLKKLTKNAYCYRVIKRTHILFSDVAQTPFCWSSFRSSYVIIPTNYLEKRNDLQLAIRHELQHIRQGDTVWLHFISIVKIFCFWNPFVTCWSRWFEELQEFACDEMLVLRKPTSRVAYVQCLLDAASKVKTADAFYATSLSIIGLSKRQHSFTLNRRVTMIFNYKQIKIKKVSLISAYAACFLSASSIAYALEGASAADALSPKEVAAIIEQSNAKNVLHISAVPGVVRELNRIRSSDQARSYLLSALKRMKEYEKAIEPQFNRNKIPYDLLAIPLVESGYQPLEAHKNPVQAAGIWQIIPTTGKQLGLTINAHRDDRLDTQLSTKAAIKYLSFLYEQFHDWKLAVLSYEYGEKEIAKLIAKVGSRDAWKLANSSAAPKHMKDFLILFDASVIIMQNPTLLDT